MKTSPASSIPALMRKSTLRGFLLAFTLLCTTLNAQRTWIVDGANGPGTDFKYFYQAVIAAKNGDTILVRKGNYWGYTTVDKAIIVLGESGATMHALEIKNIPKGERFVMKGFVVSAYFPRVPIQLLLKDNKGQIHLENLTVIPFAAPNPKAAIEIENCSSVTLNNCNVTVGGRWLRPPGRDVKAAPLIEAEATDQVSKA